MNRPDRSRRLGWALRTEDFRRHLSDLARDGYEGATGRDEREEVFANAVALLTPVVTDVLRELSDYYMSGTGSVQFESRSGDWGMEAVWSLGWPDQARARRRAKLDGPRDVGPIRVMATFPPGWTHGHLRGEHLGHWPLQVVTPEDAWRQYDLVWSIAEAELHEWIYSAEHPWDLVRAVPLPQAIALASPGGRLTSQLRRRRPVRGIFMGGVGAPETLDSAAGAGLDFVVVDQEHAPSTSDEELAIACEIGHLLGIAVLVRISAPDPNLAAKALDLGAAGIVVPQCRTREDVERALDGSFMPPLGSRGFSPSTRVAGRVRGLLGEGRLADVVSVLNRSTAMIVQVETPELLDSLSEVADDDRIDAFLLGAHDLAVASGDPAADIKDAASGRIATALDGHRAGWGLVVDDTTRSAALALGATFLVLGNATALRARAIRALADRDVQ